MKIIEFAGRRCLFFTLILFPALTLLAPSRTVAQALVAGEEKQEENKPVQLPFLLPAQPTEIGEAMEDFRRFSGRKQWEKAFKHLEKVFAATADGLVLTADGIMLPSRMIAREALLELPVPGQDAYRLFFDAEAKKLLEQAIGKEEVTKLGQIFSRFLVTTSGDTAADKLGDLYFEEGHLDQAVNAWRTIIEQRPDSQISKVRLQTKIAVALARLGRWTEFAEVQKTIEQQFPNEKMTIGGKEVTAVSYLQTIAEQAKNRPAIAVSTTKEGVVADIPLPEVVEPLWQFRFFPATDPKEGVPVGLQMQNQNRWGDNQQQTSDWIPPVVADEKRAYVNFAGYDIAVDMENGKLLWRSGRFFDIQQKAQQQQLSPLEQHGLSLGAGRLWSVARDAGGNNQNQNMGMRGGGGGGKFALTARELDTGKKVIESGKVNGLKDYSFRGTPLIVREELFIAVNNVNQPRDLEILCLNTKDGKTIWSRKIGSYTTESNPWMNERSFQPSLLWHGGHLYVDTHSGSLVQLDAASGQVEWGLNYLSETTQTHRFWGWWGMNMNSEHYTVGVPQMVNGILYLKGMRSRKLYAVDPQRPRVVSHRSVPMSANLIGIDESHFYLGGDDISAFDLNTKKILWSVKLSPGTNWTTATMTPNRIYQFSPRGIFEIDKADGKVARVFRGADLQSMGGSLIVTPKVLLAVSNLAVTAYPLPGRQTESKPDNASASVGTPNNATAAVKSDKQ